MAFIFPRFVDSIFSCFQTSEKINCFHCNERMKKQNALFVNFNGSSQPVCCHGCLVILQFIERSGMTQQYLQAKIDMKVAEAAQ